MSDLIIHCIINTIEGLRKDKVGGIADTKLRQHVDEVLTNLRNFLQGVDTPGYSKEQFDNMVYANGYVYYRDSDKTLVIDGEFTAETLQMVNYAMNNHPEWFKLDDLA
jgi:hypothetical protein